MIHLPTGEVITSENGVNEKSKYFSALWLDEFINEPSFNDKTIELAWSKFLEGIDIKVEVDDNGFYVYEWDYLKSFIEGLNMPNMIAYEITTSGIAYGSISMTAMYIVDKEVVVEVLK